MRFAHFMTLATLALAPAAAFASSHCTCSEQCMTECQKGKGENCQCKACDCKKSGKCSKESCKTHERQPSQSK